VLTRSSRPSSHHYRCVCGRRVFFRNSACLACGSALGFLSSDASLHALVPGSSPHTWRVTGHDGLFTRCANFDTAAGCNWLVPLDDQSPHRYCIACALNRRIPDLSVPENGELWGRMERAKRRVIAQLLELGLPVVSKAVDPRRGLAFDFLRSLPGQPKVMTGHADGVITIDIDEADDAHRERARQQLHEPYRTLLGHLRHEVGHHYWLQLVADTDWLPACRELFGDERADYAAALKRNYDNGPPPDWASHFISAYASSHPWEDWAETWAHYLHLRDTLATAAGFRLLQPLADAGGDKPFTADALWRPDHPTGPAFLELLHTWIAVTSVMNEMSRAMGQPDFYPFVLVRDVVPKLHFIHCVIDAAARGDAPPQPRISTP